MCDWGAIVAQVVERPSSDQKLDYPFDPWRVRIAAAPGEKVAPRTVVPAASVRMCVWMDEGWLVV